MFVCCRLRVDVRGRHGAGGAEVALRREEETEEDRQEEYDATAEGRGLETEVPQQPQEGGARDGRGNVTSVCLSVCLSVCPCMGALISVGTMNNLSVFYILCPPQAQWRI